MVVGPLLALRSLFHERVILRVEAQLFRRDLVPFVRERATESLRI